MPWRTLDTILRGDATNLEDLRGGRLRVQGWFGLIALMTLLAAVAGACTGSFALLRDAGPVWPQTLASAAKVPVLFALTVLITLPSLYVFNVLVGSRLRLGTLVQLIVASLGVTAAVLASLAPITAFFALSSDSYPFMVLVNVVQYAVAGLLGLKFLLQTLHRLSLAETPAPAAGQPPPPPAVGVAKGPLAMPGGTVLGGDVRLVFRIWVVVFGLVGSQLAWVMRPFVGSPDEPFSLFRERESNFFAAVLRSAGALLGVDS